MLLVPKNVLLGILFTRPNDLFLKILIQKQKLISDFAADCRKTISGTQNYFQIQQVDWLEALIK